MQFRRSIFPILAGLFVSLSLASAAWAAPVDLSSFSGKKGTVAIAGGTAHIPVMKEAAKRIMKANPAITITVAGGGSGVGVKQLGEGLADIGNTGRPLKPGEIEQYKLVSHAFAIDGVALAVHPANPVSVITAEQAKAVFDGTISNWKQLGGNDSPISLYTREDGSGTREVFVEKAIANGSISPKAAIVSSNGAIKTAIAKDVNAIGYIGIGTIDTGIKALDFDGVVANQANASSGSYGVTRKLFMNTKENPSELVSLFIAYILSDKDGQEIISAAGYIPLPK